MSDATLPAAAKKSVLSRLGPLSPEQRADYLALINQGIDPATARAIVQGYAGVRKADRPNYHQAYTQLARKTLPAWQHDQLHAQARSVAGGHACAEARQAPDQKTANLQELDLLQQRMDWLQQQVAKDALSASDVHVDVPLGAVKPKPKDKKVSVVATPADDLIAQAYAVIGKGNFDESAHPRADNGQFGPGASRAHLHASNRHARAAAQHLDDAKAAFEAKDSVAFDHHMKLAQQSHELNRAAWARAKNVKKAQPDAADALAYAQAAYDLQAPAQAAAPDASQVPPAAVPLMQANRLVAGMDAEMAAGASTAEDARRRASAALRDRPGFYDTVGNTPQTARLAGVMLDLGCGDARAPGYIGLDLGTFGDYGTAICDINANLSEFPDGSVKAVRLVNSLHNILDDDGQARNPTALLTELQRVMCEGAELYYQGPEPLYEAESGWPAPALVLQEESSDEASGMVTQTLVRVPPRVPAYVGADANFAPAGPVPIDVALALAAYNEAPARAAMARLVSKSAGRVVRIAKAEPLKQVLIGVVLEPLTQDLQGDVMLAEDIEAAAHGFLGTSRVIGSEHGAPITAHPVESYIAPQDLTFEGPNGTTVVTKGSWVLGVKVQSPEEWRKVMDGGYTGFSVGGFGLREDM